MLVQLNALCTEIATDAALDAIETSAASVVAGLGVDGVGEGQVAVTSNCDGHTDNEGDRYVVMLEGLPCMRARKTGAEF